MSMTLTLNQPTLRPTRRVSIMSFLAKIGDGIREGQAIEARYDALCNMSNTDLARRGMTRSDIIQAALVGGNC